MNSEPILNITEADLRDVISVLDSAYDLDPAEESYRRGHLDLDYADLKGSLCAEVKKVAEKAFKEGQRYTVAEASPDPAPPEIVTTGEQERLVCLIEECAEVAQNACKILRFGLDHVSKRTGMTNKQNLEDELGDIGIVQSMMIANDDISSSAIIKFQKEKVAKRIANMPLQPENFTIASM